MNWLYVRETGLTLANMLRAFQVGKALIAIAVADESLPNLERPQHVRQRQAGLPHIKPVHAQNTPPTETFQDETSSNEPSKKAGVKKAPSKGTRLKKAAPKKTLSKKRKKRAPKTTGENTLLSRPPPKL